MSNKHIEISANKSAKNNWKNQLTKIFYSVKSLIFDFYQISLFHNETTELFAFVISLLQWVQILLLLFEENFTLIWRESTFVTYFDTLAEIVHISPLILKSEPNLLLIFVIGLTIIVIMLYTSGIAITIYSVNNRVNSHMLNIIIYYCLLFLPSVLFIPLIDGYLFFFSCEKAITGEYTMVSSDYVCFKGYHLIGFIFSVIGFLLYLIIIGITDIFYIETRTDSRNTMASKLSYSFLGFRMVILIEILFSHILSAKEFKYTILLFNLLASCYLIVVFYIREQFYSKLLSKVYSLGALIFAWISICMFISATFKEIMFDDINYLFFTGGVLLLVIDAIYLEKGKLPLVIAPKVFKESRDMLDYLFRLNELGRKYKKNPQIAKMINGFASFHAERCLVPQCPLKKKFINNGPAITLVNNFHNFTLNNLILYMNICFEEGIKLCESDVGFRLEFIFFLIDLKKDKIAAIRQLKIAETMEPNIQQEFIIYRYKKLIEEVSNEKKIIGFSLENEYAINQLAYNNATLNLSKNIEKATRLFIEIWTVLNNSRIDINKVLSLAKKIYKIKNKINKLWINFDRSFAYNKARQTLLFNKYLEDVWNQQLEGTIAKAKIDLYNEIANNSDLNCFDFNDNISKISAGCFIISGEIDNLGIIIDVNSQACIYFGYHKHELLGKSIDNLIHPVIAKYHNDYLINANTKKNLNYFVKARKVYGTDNNGYIIPVNLAIKKIHGMKVFYASYLTRFQQTEFIGSLMVDENGMVLSISKTCVLMFGIYQADIENKSEFDKYFPKLFDKKDKFKNGKYSRLPIKFVNTEIIGDLVEPLRLYVEEVKYQLRKKPLYIFHFKQNSNNSENIETSQYMPDPCDFSFLYSLSQNKIRTIVKTNKKSANKKININSKIRYSDANSEKIPANIDYGKGIKTLRLENGKAIDLADDDSESLSKGHSNQILPTDSKTSKHQLADHNDFEANFGKSIISTLQKKIEYLKLPSFFIIYILSCIALIISLLAITGCNFGMKLQNMDSLNDYLSVYSGFDETTFNTQILANLVSELIIIKNVANSKIEEKYTRDYMLKIISELEEIDQEVIKNILLINNSDLRYKLLKDNISFQVDDELQSLDYNGIIKHYAAKAYTIVNSTLDNITINSPEVTFITQNSLDLFYQETKFVSDSIFNAALMLIDHDKQSVLFLLLIIGISALWIGLYILYELKLRSYITKILVLFLELKPKDLDIYITRNHEFLNTIKADQIETINSTRDNMIYNFQEDYEDEDFNQNYNGSKRYTGKLYMNVKYLVLFIVFFILYKALFAVSLFKYNIDSNVMVTLLDEFNSTSKLRNEYFRSTNLIYTYILKSGNDSLKIANQTATDFFNSTDNHLMQLNSEIYTQNLINKDFHSKTYNKIISIMFHSDFCDYVEKNDTIKVDSSIKTFDGAVCRELYVNDATDYLLKDGITVSLAQYIENLQTIINNFITYEASNYTDYRALKDLGCNVEKNTNSACLFNGSEAHENYRFKYKGLTNIFYIWIYLLLDDIKSYHLTRSYSIQLMFLIILTVLILLLFTWIIVKYLLLQTKKIKMVNNLLLMIPFDSIKTSNNIRKYIKNKCNECLKE